MHLPQWNSYEKAAFRFFFLYFFLQILPWDGQLFRQLLAGPVHFKQWLDIASYTPTLGGNKWLDWLFVAGIAFVGSVVWGLIDAERLQYRNALYWLRTVLRYRLGIAIFSYGIYKLFLLQMPAPGSCLLYAPAQMRSGLIQHYAPL